MMRASVTVLVVLVHCITTLCLSNELRWDHSVDLDENFRLLWKVKHPDIIFEVQARTLGYIGIGFARSEFIYSADMYVGWVDTDHTFFQVSFCYSFVR
jgi:DOMON domain